MDLADDGSFVETPSGSAARALKRLYDQAHGVGKGGIVSPYATTSLNNQHGKPVHRVG